MANRDTSSEQDDKRNSHHFRPHLGSWRKAGKGYEKEKSTEFETTAWKYSLS
jgi:hypothetical protein